MRERARHRVAVEIRKAQKAVTPRRDTPLKRSGSPPPATASSWSKESRRSARRVPPPSPTRDHAAGGKLRFSLKVVELPDRDSFGDTLTTVVVGAATGISIQHKRPRGKNQDTLLTDFGRQHRRGKVHFSEADILHSAKELGMDKPNRNALRDLCTGDIKVGTGPFSLTETYGFETTGPLPFQGGGFQGRVAVSVLEPATFGLMLMGGRGAAHYYRRPEAILVRTRPIEVKKWCSQLFLVKREHQPCGLITPSTILQAFGG